MSSRKNKVVVAMSGGVDSSVAACLLVEQGYDVVGLFMRIGGHGEPGRADTENGGSSTTIPLPLDHNAGIGRRAHQGCCSAADAADARFVAGMLGIPFYALNFQNEFRGIIDDFADEYARGRTPNPCVVCNDRLKFGRLMEYAGAVGAEHVATGHYARVGLRDGRRCLMRGADAAKDQSYVLFGLKTHTLDRVIFPLGELSKTQVRAIAAHRDLPNWDKPDSVEICFVPGRDYARVVRERRPEAFRPGEVVDTAGHVIGQHDGLANFTVGQRRGLRIAAGRPIYVKQLDADRNRVVMGGAEDILSGELIADRVNMLAETADVFRADVKIRYLHAPAPAQIHRLGGERVRVVFDEPQRAVAPGQAAVFYDGDVVLGGGWIR